MAKITSIRVQNLRAIEDSGHIPLKPITILVGKNSVGKSTFARTFPLLRQSNEAKRRAPVLWWGKYVDFGSFKDAVHKNDIEKEITMSFSIDLSIGEYDSHHDFLFGDLTFSEEEAICNVEVTLSASASEQTFVKRVSIDLQGVGATVCIGHNGEVTDVKSTTSQISWKPTDAFRAVAEPGQFLPNLRWVKRAKDQRRDYFIREYASPFASRLLGVVLELSHGNTDLDKIKKIASQVPFGSKAAVLKRIRQLAGSGPATWKKSVNALNLEDWSLLRLRDAALLNYLPEFLDYLNYTFGSFSSGVRYIEPLRATAERYYRVQELAVDEIDSKGENLAVFLYSMHASRLLQLNNWLADLLGFTVEPIKTEGHISIRLRSNGSDLSANLADTGFGLSQVLPIAVQLWASTSSSNLRASTQAGEGCFVVEQPELHLHPAFQERIADLFVAAVKRTTGSRGNLRIIAETHSSNLINRLGELISEGQISPDSVQVLVFEQPAPFEPVTIKHSKFDDDGVLQNWPYGFFSSGRLE